MTHLLEHISRDWRHSKFLPLAGKALHTPASPPTTSGPWPFLPSDFSLSNQLFPKQMEHISHPDLWACTALSIFNASVENSTCHSNPPTLPPGGRRAPARNSARRTEQPQTRYVNFRHTCIHSRIMRIIWILSILTMCVEKERTRTIWWNINDRRAS